MDIKLRSMAKVDEGKVAAAIQRIRSFCSGKSVLCAFSGGKDSQCCYHLCKEAGVEFAAQYSITRFEPPELIRFIRDNYPDVSFRREYKDSLVAEIEKRGLPSRWVRWCCTCKHRKTEGFDISVVGVRAAESPRRAKTWRMFGQRQDRSFYVCPIIDWTEENVWGFLNSRKIPHCSLYDEGFDRIGCVMCPLVSQRLRLRDAARYPKTVAMLRIGSDKFVNRGRMAGFVTKRGRKFPNWCKSENPEEEYFKRWMESGQTSMPLENCTNNVEQMCLFAGTGFSESDGEVENEECQPKATQD